MKSIQITGEKGRGKSFLVDNEDYDKVKNFNWHLSYYGYPRTQISKKKVLVHRLILGAKVGDLIDHKNRDTLDNRKINLHFCNSRQNQVNQKIRIDNKSGYKGVSWYSHKKKWVAELCLFGKKVFCKQFDTKEDAARAYNENAVKYHGDICYLNNV